MRGRSSDKPESLFLDETTSALDEKLEEQICPARWWARLLPSATVVSIGRRLSLMLSIDGISRCSRVGVRVFREPDADDGGRPPARVQ